MKNRTKLIPPLESFYDPRVVGLCELLTEENVEVTKVDFFPLFSPFVDRTQCDINLKRGCCETQTQGPVGNTDLNSSIAYR